MGLLGARVAIVTGSGSGIGRGISLAFASEGATVVVADLVPERAAETVALVAARGGAALAVTCDVCDPHQVRACVDVTIGRYGRIDVLVNNAVAPPLLVPLLETSIEQVDEQWRSGPLASMLFMQACHPHLKASGGNVVNVSSRAGMDGTANLSAYAQAKEAMRTLTKVAAREWGPDGIRVNAICPAAATPAHARWTEEHPELAAERVALRPLGRVGDPELDVGRAVVMLASDYAAYVTGNTLMVDGGTCSW